MDGGCVDKQDRLVAEGLALLGMIDEVKVKARLMLNKVRSLNTSDMIDDDFMAEADSKVRGFYSDLRKYGGRLGEIGQILKEQYGFDVVY